MGQAGLVVIVLCVAIYTAMYMTEVMGVNKIFGCVYKYFKSC
jgi:hypothetical protein